MTSRYIGKCIEKKIGIIIAPVLFFLSTLSAFASTETIQYIYDDARQLSKVIYGNGTTIEYIYDSSGNRLVKTISFGGAPVNHPPSPPSNITPASSATGVALTQPSHGRAAAIPIRAI